MDISQIATVSAFLKGELIPVFEKLGMAGQFGYKIFIKQAYANAFTGLLMWIPAGICLFFVYFCFKLEEKWNKEGDINNQGGGYVLAVVFTLAFLLLFLLPLNQLIQTLINPDYQAIKLILETIQNK